MTTPTLPYNSSTYAVDYLPGAGHINDFDRSDMTGGLKQFLLRAFVKQQIGQNENLQVLTDVTLYDMQTNQTILGHNETTPHFAASINKLPVALLLLEDLKAKKVTLDTQVTWQVSDRRAGNGVFDKGDAPLSATVRDVLYDMLNHSGNTAVRVIVNGVLGGPYAVNDRLAAKAQLAQTRLIPLDSNRFYLGNTTSKEALWTLRQILGDKSGFAATMKQYLATNIFVEDGVRSQLAGNDYILLVNKTGLLYDPDGNNHHDVGVIYNTRTHKAYGYSFLTTAPSNSVDADNRAIDSAATMGKYTLRFAGDKPAHSQPQTPDSYAAPRALSAPQTTPDTKMVY